MPIKTDMNAIAIATSFCRLSDTYDVIIMIRSLKQADVSSKERHQIYRTQLIFLIHNLLSTKPQPLVDMDFQEQ